MKSAGRRGFLQHLIADGAGLAEEVPLAVTDVEFQDIDHLALGLDLLSDALDPVAAE